jgi:hypothetical protein
MASVRDNIECSSQSIDASLASLRSSAADAQRLGPRMRRLLVELLLSLVALADATAQPGPSRAPIPWATIGTSPEVVLSLDTSRVEVDTVGQRVWLRFDYATDQTVPPTPKGPYRRTVVLENIDCALRRTRDIEMLLFDRTGIQLVRFPFPTAAWTSFDKHAMTATYFDLACQALFTFGKLLRSS